MLHLEHPSTDEKRIAFLDGLRGLAVLAVVFFHASKFVPAIAHSTTFGTALLQQLCHGVDLFFILSGFCLAYPTLKKLSTRGALQFDVAAYAARRVVRIVPPYYAAILLLALAASLAWVHAASPNAIPNAGAYDIARQALFIDADVHLLNGSFWSLAVEFRWYFLFPLVLWLWIRSPRGFLIAGAGVALAATLTRAQSLDLLFLPTFMLGIVAAAAFVEKQRVRTWLVWLLLFSTLAFLKSRNDGWAWSTNPLWGIAMFWLVVGAAESRYLYAVFSHRWLTKIGYGSYGIYLTHEPVIRLLSPVLSFVPGGWALFGVLAGAAVAFGLAFSFVAERPFTQGKLRNALVGVIEHAFTRFIAEINGTGHIPLVAAANGSDSANAA